MSDKVLTPEPTIPHYAQQLSMELKQRQIGNPRYSLRAFAQTLGLSPAHLSKVLRSEKRLSLEAAAKIAERLRYSESEARQFCELVSRAQVKNEKYVRVLGWASQGEEEYPSLTAEAFRVISSWYHCAIRELTDCRDFSAKPEHLAKRLGITTNEASEALKSLVRVGLLKKHGTTYRKATPSFAISSRQPSRAIRHFHSQMMQKAREALENQPVEDRDISAITLAISPDKVQLAREEIQKFRRRMAKLLDTTRPSAVYQMNVQFFRLDQVRDSEGGDL